MSFVGFLGFLLTSIGVLGSFFVFLVPSVGYLVPFVVFLGSLLTSIGIFGVICWVFVAILLGFWCHLLCFGDSC